VSTDLKVGNGLVLPADELEWSAVRSSGPGGQNVNKVSTKVELRFDAAGSAALAEPVRARLLILARGRLDADGRILVTCDETRSQSRNLELARERLAELVARALIVPKRRRATKPSKAAKARRVEQKRRTGTRKRERARHDGD
jgi:ribosome-associated protein